MKKEYVRVIKKGSEIFSIYPSVNCFLNDITAPETEKAFNSSEQSSKKTNEPNWSGTKNWEEAMALRDGWLKGVQKLKFEKKKDLGIDEALSVCGARVDIGEYLEGNPENMILHENAPAKKRINVIANITAHAGYTSEQLLERGNIVFSVFQSLAKDYDVKISAGMYEDYGSGKKLGLAVCLKDYGQAFIKNNVAFAFHTSFFRRLGFRYIENHGYGHSGYGSPTEFGTLNTSKGLEYDIVIPGISTVDNDDLAEWVMDVVRTNIK